MQTHIWRLQSCAPYFNANLSWMPNTWAYVDLFAIYQGSDLSAQHSEWILHDGSGRQLYVPWGCANGTCPQFAGDISNPAFRDWWISNTSSLLAAGYQGLWLDDVDLDLRVSDGNGNSVPPIDRTTGAPMTAENWRRYMAEFVEQIRAALPSYEILHNSIWYASPTGFNDEYVTREIKAADYINLEGGASDTGLTGLSGQWSVGALLSFIDAVRSYGRSVVLDEFGFNGDYGLAGYFLVSDGSDAIGNQAITPNNWWSGYDVNLGTARRPRYLWNNLLRRDFSGGMVLLNPPKTNPVTVGLPGPLTKLDDGSRVSVVTVSPGQAIILTGGFPSPDFQLSLTPSVETTVAGAVVTFNATVTPSYGFAVDLSPSVRHEFRLG